MQAKALRVGPIAAPSANSPLEHFRFLHRDAGRGYITIAQKLEAGSRKPFEQRTGPFKDLTEVVPAYGGMADVYVSLNRFYGSRKKSRLAELSSLFSDVDYFKVPELADLSPAGAFLYALDALEAARIPPPSLAISTGRGLALVWRHEPVSRAVLGKWDLCQEHIYRALKDLGADPKAKDAVRVMRPVGTYNSKSGTAVEAIWEDADREVWDFGALSDEILPLTRAELEQRRTARLEGRAQERPKEGAKKSRKRHGRPAEGRSPRTLHEGRLRDLERLLELRGQAVLPAGERDGWMFAAACAMSYLWEPPAFERELISLGRERAGWDEDETRSRMHAVIENARSAAAGGTVEWSGQKRDPRYRLKNDSIIRDLAITPGEEARMGVIISAETKASRDRGRKERERRSRGAVPRDEYVAEAREKRQHQRRAAKELRGQGWSLRKIGAELNISHTQVKRLLNLLDEAEPAQHQPTQLTPTNTTNSGGR